MPRPRAVGAHNHPEDGCPGVWHILDPIKYAKLLTRSLAFALRNRHYRIKF